MGAALVCLFLYGLASLAEAGITSLSRARVKNLIDGGLGKAKAMDQLLDQARAVYSTFRLVHILTAAGFIGLILFLAASFLGPYWNVVIYSIVAGGLLLTFINMLTHAMIGRQTEPLVLSLAPLVTASAFLFRPLTKTLEAIIDGVIRVFRFNHRLSTTEVQEEELLKLAEITTQDNVIEADEREMIRGVFGLEETTAREIMVPRIDIVAVDTEASLTEVITLIVERGFSRIPLYEETIDNIVGVIYAKDLLRHWQERQPPVALKDLARSPYFIPESKKIGELLRELQQQKVHMAIVVDEYGGTAGLVTIEDLLEEIVGEIEDEYDREELQIERVSEHEAVLDGRVSIDDLNQMFELDIQGEDFDTVGGFVYNQLGKMVVPGDQIRTQELTLTVLSTLGRRIKKVRVTRISQALESPQTSIAEPTGDRE